MVKRHVDGDHGLSSTARIQSPTELCIAHHIYSPQAPRDVSLSIRPRTRAYIDRFPRVLLLSCAWCILGHGIMIDCATLKTTSTGKNPRPGKTLGSAAHAPRNTQVVPLYVEIQWNDIVYCDSGIKSKYAIRNCRARGRANYTLHFPSVMSNIRSGVQQCVKPPLISLVAHVDVVHTVNTCPGTISLF